MTAIAAMRATMRIGPTTRAPRRGTSASAVPSATDANAMNNGKSMGIAAAPRSRMPRRSTARQGLDADDVLLFARGRDPRQRDRGPDVGGQGQRNACRRAALALGSRIGAPHVVLAQGALRCGMVDPDRG